METAAEGGPPAPLCNPRKGDPLVTPNPHRRSALDDIRDERHGMRLGRHSELPLAADVRGASIDASHRGLPREKVGMRSSTARSRRL
jgi:hypothetical protein